MLSFYQFALLFDSIGYVIPTRHLLGSFMCIQFFMGPFFAYNGLDKYQYFIYKMKIPEEDYFQYSIPAIALFILGLHVNSGNYKGEKINIKEIEKFVHKNPTLPYYFIGLGFISSIVSIFFSSDLAFVFYLLGSFKFIGLFLLILGEVKIKLVPLVIVLGSIVSSSLGSGMFHDLLTWVIYTSAVLSIKYKFDLKVKMIGMLSFISLFFIIQVLKGDYRKVTSFENQQAGVETMAKLYQKENEDKGVFSFENLATSNVRINQGFIITNIMSNVPAKVPFSEGEELYKILEAAILPRIIAPDKLSAGDRTIFVKYSGIIIQSGTSMGLSSLGDAYINFNVVGGCIFMFVLGLFYSEVLNAFNKYGKDIPLLLLFVAMVFYYPIRPDCEMQTILGHLFKSCFLIYLIVQIWKPTFKSIS